MRLLQNLKAPATAVSRFNGPLVDVPEMNRFIGDRWASNVNSGNRNNEDRL